MRRVNFRDLPALAGEEVGISEWLLVDQQRVNKFAEATGDFQWIHVDPERAKREMGGTIAHGYLILPLIPLLSKSVIEVMGVAHGLNYGLNKVRFTGIVRVGGRVRLRERILSVDPRGRGLLTTYEFIIDVEGSDRPACVAEGPGLMYPA